MDKAASKAKMECISLVPKDIPEEITESDEERFFRVVEVGLNGEQRSWIETPSRVEPRQESVLAIHWHPEFVPLELIRRRIDATFPNRSDELIIPTQHNELLTYDGYSGVEVDCFSAGFNQKVQLLLHFETEKMGDAPIFREMLAHTFKYRSSQLFDFIRTITRPLEDRLDQAARETGANASLVHFVRVYVGKVSRLLDTHMDRVPAASIKNKLLRNFFDTLRREYGDPLIDRAQTFLTAVKKIVKGGFPLKYFYRTSEVIEEARGLKAGIVIPHPEQFWPILLAEYDVDGYEVWNPQSQKYTEFLISVLDKKNRAMSGSGRPLLIFMGDDTHMGEKTRHPRERNPEKAAREVGFQPAWENLSIRKSLITAGASRKQVIEAYKARLAG